MTYFHCKTHFLFITWNFVWYVSPLLPYLKILFIFSTAFPILGISCKKWLKITTFWVLELCANYIPQKKAKMSYELMLCSKCMIYFKRIENCCKERRFSFAAKWLGGLNVTDRGFIKILDDKPKCWLHQEVLKVST